jgi:hypothetical protein
MSNKPFRMTKEVQAYFKALGPELAVAKYEIRQNLAERIEKADAMLEKHKGDRNNPEVKKALNEIKRFREAINLPDPEEVLAHKMNNMPSSDAFLAKKTHVGERLPGDGLTSYEAPRSSTDVEAEGQRMKYFATMFNNPTGKARRTHRKHMRSRKTKQRRRFRGSTRKV